MIIMNSSLKIHPISFINAMSNALELSAVGISKHHHRTAIIAKYIGIKYVSRSITNFNIFIFIT